HASATRLLQCIDSAHADLVIPISDRDAQICALAQTLRPSASSFVSAPRESVEVTSSPGATVSLGDRLNIPMPANVAVSDKAQLTERANHFGYPVVVKLAHGATQRTFLVASERDLSRLLGRLPERVECVLERPVRGDFLSVTGFASSGQLLTSFSLR